MAGGPEREEEELCHLKTSSDEPHSHMLGMVVVDSPSATPHCPQRQSVEAQTGLFAVEFASSCPPPILIEANQAGQEGIATLPVLVISMQAV